MNSLKTFWIQNLFVFFGLTAAAFAVPMFYDDGWVVQRASQFEDVGFFGDYFFHSNAWLPQGYINELIFSSFISQDVSFLFLRFLVVIVLFITWIFIQKLAVLLQPNHSVVGVWISAAIFVAIAGPWCMSLRGEPWVCLFLAVQLYFFAKLVLTNKLFYFFLSGIFAALAFSAHQTGFMALIPMAAMVFFLFKHHAYEFVIEKVTVFIATLSVAIIIFFVGYDLSSIIENVRDFSDTYYQNRLNEFFRISEIAGPAYSSARKFGWLLFLAVVAAGIFTFGTTSGIVKTFLSIALLMPFALILTSSKWGWHLGALLVPTLVIASLAINGNPIKIGKHSLKFALVLPLLTLIVAISLAGSAGWGTYDSRQFDWSSFSNTFAGPETQTIWFAAVLFFLLLGLLIDFRVAKNLSIGILGSSLVSILILTPSLLSFYWISADSFTPRVTNTISWTMLRQNIKQIVDNNPSYCGILGTMPAYAGGVSPKSVSEQAANTSDATFGSMKSVDTQLFPFDNVLAWETNPLFDKNESPIFNLDFSGESNVSFWTSIESSESDYATTLLIEYFLEDDSRAYESFSISQSSEGKIWVRHNLSPPVNAISFKVQFLETQSKVFQLIQPSSVVSTTASEILMQGTALVPPSYLPAVPCASLGSSNQGLFPLNSFLIAGDFGLDAHMWMNQYFSVLDYAATDLGQIEFGTPKIWNLQYQKSTGFLVEKVTDQ